MSRNARFVRSGKPLKGGALRTIELVQSNDVCMVQKIKRLHNEIRLSMLTNLEELQHTQIKLHLACGCEEVAAKTKGPRREWKCAAMVRVESSQ